jgi:hypothetical protein
MGAFLLALKHELGPADTELAAARAVLAASGFDAPHRFIGPEYALYAYPKLGTLTIDLRTYSNGDFIFCCGTMIFRRKIGSAAIDEFYRSFRGTSCSCDESYGHFSVVLRKNNQLFVVGDPNGGYPIYYDRRLTIFSSSFLAIAEHLQRLTCPKQAVFEYVFNGVVSGDETIFADIRLLPRNGQVVIDAGRAAVKRSRLLHRNR